MGKHTPGPWSLSTVPTSMGTCHKIGPFPSNGVYAVTHACVYADNVREHDYGHSKTGDELLANARLIAAAPDLLAVVTTAVDMLEEPLLRDVFGQAWVDAAKSAIARAKGEQHG